MKVFLFFICMIFCAVQAHAEPLAKMFCSEGEVQHIYQGDSDDHDIIYIDGSIYNLVKEHTVGDVSFTEYASNVDKNELAFIQVNLEEYADEVQDVKLVLMRKGAGTTEFGGSCVFDG